MTSRYLLIRPLRLFALSLTLMVTSIPALAALSASVDRTELGEQDTLVYTLRSDGTSASALDLTPLQKNFFILGSSRSNQIRMVNGNNESWTEWNITLQPRNEGTLTIPALTYSGSSSNPITVEVSKGSQTNTDLPILMQNQLSSDKLWEGQEAVLVLDVLSRANFSSNPDLSSPEADGLIFKLLDKEQRSEKVIDGLRYQVITLSYLVTPTRAGTFTIPGQTLTGAYSEEDPYSYSRLLMGRSRPFRIDAPDLTLTVNPPPANWPTKQPWLPAESINITEHWTSDPADLKSGDSITRTVTISAKGVNSAQIPPLPALKLTGVNSYPDQPKTKNNLTAAGNVATRSESVALVPTQPGEITLPTIKVNWFNTKTSKVEVATLPAQTLTIAQGEHAAAPNPVTLSTTEATTPASTPTTISTEPFEDAALWKWSTLSFALLWLGTLAYALRERLFALTKNAAIPGKWKAPTTANQEEAVLFKKLLEACENNQINSIEGVLLNWGQSLPNMRGQTISDILHTLGHQRLDQAWALLLQNRYGANQSELDMRLLSNLLREAREQWLARNRTSVSGGMNINPL